MTRPSRSPFPRPPRTGRWFLLLSRPGMWAKLDWLFWKCLCCRPDGGPIHAWWYGLTGRIASYCHARHCTRCRERAGIR